MDFTHNVISNLAVATILALLAWGIGRMVVRPQIRHVLWVLVLCKLISPALISFPAWRITTTDSVASTLDHETLVSRATHELVEPIASTGVHRTSALAPPTVNDFRAPAAETAIHLPWLSLILGVWILGAIVWFALATVRLFAFGKALRGARVASDEWKQELQFVAGRLGLRRIPQLLLIDAAVPPMVWSFASRTLIILPDALMHQFNGSQRRGIIAHELAHLRRGDHWIRWGEFLIVGIYWWNPIAWWARREIHRAEEECCDASVVQAFPDIATDYAQTLLDTVDFLAADRKPTPSFVTAFCGHGTLNWRIEMVLNPRCLSQLPRAWGVLLGTIALGILPTSIWPTFSRGQDVNAEKTDDAGATIKSGLPDSRNDNMKAHASPLVDATDKLNWIGLHVEDFPLIGAAFKDSKAFPSKSALNKYSDRLRSEIKEAKEMPSSVSLNRLGQIEAELELTNFYIRQTEFATQIAKMALDVAEIELSAARKANRRVADAYSEQAISELQRRAEEWRLRYQQLAGEVPAQASSSD